jgi:hypothetical protein
VLAFSSRSIVSGTRVAAIMALTVVATPNHGAAGAKGGDTKGPKTVVGAWLVDVTPVIQPAFVSLTTFTEDGGVIETNSLAIGSPPETPGHGRWHRTGSRDFTMTFWNILGDGSGGFAGTAKIKAAVRVHTNGDAWQGTFEVDVYDPTGTEVFSDSGTVSATRIKVEPLP